jgi:UDP-N-acetylmuramate dehydrogenase
MLQTVGSKDKFFVVILPSYQKTKKLMHIYENYSLLKYNTFHLNVKTRWFVEYESEEDLQKLQKDKHFCSKSIYHIGQGSNLLFLNNFEGTIVHSGIKGIEIIEENKEYIRLKVGASENWDSFVSYCVDKGWGGIENLSLIPGEVGASAFQNIGAYGVEISNVIDEVHTYSVITKSKRIFSYKECNYSYRHSFFKNSRGTFYITHVVYRLSKKPQFKLDYDNIKFALKGKEINLSTIRKAIVSIRQSYLPNIAIFGNAGSFFTNPYIHIAHYERLKKQYPSIPFYPIDKKTVKIPAAWLIEQCGGKGKYLGGAAIYKKQPLIIVNQGNATGKDIAQLAEKIYSLVKDTFGIELQTEVDYL